jgi:phytoene dehydrogenase-like protein
MDCEVAVVGGGIGGLTVAALLAARGLKVCLLEKEPRVGGCAASFEKFGYSFEQGYGLYAGWQTNEIHARVFFRIAGQRSRGSPVGAKPMWCVFLIDPRSPSEVGTEAFEESLSRLFPQCAEQALAFYRKLASLSAAMRRALQRTPESPVNVKVTTSVQLNCPRVGLALKYSSPVNNRSFRIWTDSHRNFGAS